MKTLYLDLFSGISGDMFIGALLDLGLDPERFQQELKKLGLPGYHLHIGRKHKGSIEGTKFDVHPGEHHRGGEPAHEHDHGHPHAHEHGGGPSHSHSHGHEHAHEESRNYAQIRRLIQDSHLSDWVKSKSLAVFHRIAVAEGKI